MATRLRSKWHDMARQKKKYSAVHDLHIPVTLLACSQAISRRARICTTRSCRAYIEIDNIECNLFVSTEESLRDLDTTGKFKNKRNFVKIKLCCDCLQSCSATECNPSLRKKNGTRVHRASPSPVH